MRILEATIRNYRIHRELRVTFDDKLTLLEGANESGKSTAVEAIHRGLFLQSRVTGKIRDSMTSTLHAGDPEVELLFESDGRQFRVKKEFRRSRGSTLLQEEAGNSLSGEAAEEELARLLHSGPMARVTEGQLERQWSHLWVFQGNSSDDPSADAAQEAELLIQSLQEKGGAVVQQSANDRRVRRSLDQLFERDFTSKGKLKAQSPADLAKKRRDESEASVSAAEERVEKLDNALADADMATEALAAIRSSLTTTQGDLSEAEAQSREVTALELQKATLEPKLKEATALLGGLRTADGRIREARRQIEQLDRDAEPLQKLAQEEEERLRTAEADENEAQAEADDARRALDAARLRMDIASALVALRRSEAEGEQLAKKASTAQGKADEAAALRTRLAALPTITEDDADRLRTLRDRALKAVAQRDAMAAEVEVVSSDVSVQIADEAVTAGTSRKVAEVTDVHIGSDTLLRIRPGGGNALAEVRREVSESQGELETALGSLSVKTFEDAVSVEREVGTLRGTLENLEAELEALAPEEIRSGQQKVAAEIERYSGEIERGQELLDAPLEPPDTEDGAVALRRDFEAAVGTATDIESAARTRVKAAGEARRNATAAQQEAAEKVQSAMQSRNETSVLLDRDLEEFGQDEPRAARLSEAERAEERARSDVDAVQARLEELGPEQVEDRKRRLEGALEKLRQRERDESGRLHAAQALLHSDRSKDPRETLADARAELLVAEREYEAKQRDADAVRLLRSLFQEEEAALTELFTGPLADSMTAYLRPVFPGARAEVQWGDQGIEGIKLVRGRAEAFDVLSGGTKEQVAAAARLAIAEVLAESFGGSLPVVFDESFAHSDPNRTRALQDMLYRAGDRGLQVIVLATHGSDFAALGAKVITLTATPSGAGPEGSADGLPLEPTDDEPASEELASLDAGGGKAEAQAPSTHRASDGDTDAFLVALHGAGGHSGNISLRRTLGWDEERYAMARDALEAAGAIRRGQGRGGTVHLT